MTYKSKIFKVVCGIGTFYECYVRYDTHAEMNEILADFCRALGAHDSEVVIYSETLDLTRFSVRAGATTRALGAPKESKKDFFDERSGASPEKKSEIDADARQLRLI